MPSDPLHRAIDNALIAGNHLLPYIGSQHPGPDTPTADALAHYGGKPCSAFDCWMAWRALALLRTAHEATLSPPSGGRARTMDHQQAALPTTREP